MASRLDVLLLLLLLPPPSPAQHVVNLTLNGPPLQITDAPSYVVFCSPGLSDANEALFHRWLFAFHSVGVSVATAATAPLRFYLGDNATDVAQQMRAGESALFRLLSGGVGRWSSPWVAVQRLLFDPLAVPLPAFSPACVGIVGESAPPAITYAAALESWLSFPRLAAFGLGCCLLAWAPGLCRQAALYYTGGALLGTLLSMLLLVLLVNRLLPLRRLFGPLILVGATCTSLAWGYVASHLAHLVEQHKVALLAYVACSGCLALAVCYWLGPPNPRTLRIAEVALRLVAFAVMVASCQLWEVSVAAAVVIVVRGPAADAISKLLGAATHLPSRGGALTGRLRRLFWLWCPARWRPLRRKRLLTQAEFAQQGRDCTERALQDLRVHCASPECDAWRVTSRLADPAGFARFVQGGCHLSLDSDVTSDEVSSDSGSGRHPPVAASSPLPGALGSVANGNTPSRARQRREAAPTTSSSDSSLTD